MGKESVSGISKLAEISSDEIANRVRHLQNLEETLLNRLRAHFRETDSVLDTSNLCEQLGGDRIYDYSPNVFSIIKARVRALHELDYDEDIFEILVDALIVYRVNQNLEGISKEDWSWLHSITQSLSDKTYQQSLAKTAKI